MKRLSSDEFENVLIDVRKSYRLLYLYQSRVLDTVKYIGDILTLRYAGGWSWFSDSSPKDGKGSLDCWAWDWLNMYMYEFNFKDYKIDDNIIKFSLILVSDSGRFENIEAEPLEIRSFSKVETAGSQLLFMLGKNCWYTDIKEFDANHEIYKKDAQDFVHKVDNRVVLIKTFPLTRMIDSDNIIDCVSEFVKFCNEHDVTELSMIK